MAKLAGVACVVVLMCMVLVVPHAEALTCGQVATAVAPCIGYITRGGTVPPGCCSGIRDIIGAAKTTADRRNLCGCLKSLAASIKGINVGLASGLPGKCGVKAPFPISLETDCSKVN